MKAILQWLQKLFSGQLCLRNQEKISQNQRDKLIEMTSVVDMDEY